MKLLTGDGWSFIAGPAEIPEPFSSTELTDMIEYRLDDVARVFDSVAPRCDEQRWRWEAGSHFIELELTPLGLDDGDHELWGGSPLLLECPPAELLLLWDRIRRELPAVWLHDEETRMWRPEGFAEAFSIGEAHRRR